MSFLEIYNENVKDLLSDNNKNLAMLETQNKIQIPELKHHQVQSIELAFSMIQIANSKRALAATQ